MEVAEYTQDRSVGWLIHDGPFALRPAVSFAPMDGDRTLVTIQTELPDHVKAFDSSLIERSLRSMKSLIEAETKRLADASSRPDQAHSPGPSPWLPWGSVRPDSLGSSQAP